MSTHRKLLQVLSVLVILSMMFSSLSVPAASAQSGDGLKRGHNAQTGKVNFIGPESGRTLPAAKALGVSRSTRPTDPALALAKRFAPEFGLQNPARDLREKKTNRSEQGRLVVHYQQAYQGIPVMGGELIVNTNENGDLYSISGEISSGLSLSTQPAVDPERARQTALEGAASWYQQAPEDFVASEPELWIYDEGLLEPSTRLVELVWRMEVTPKDADRPVRELVLVNAQRGNISLHFNQVDTAWSVSGKAGAAQEIQPTSTPQPTETPLPTEAPTEIPDAVGTATPTAMPARPEPDSRSQVESLTAGTWYVATTGNDSNSCSDPVSPCATIQAAINKASSGNTIAVAAGTYYYTSINVNPNVVIINKSLTLSGGWEGDFSGQTGASIIDGQNTNNGILANAAGSTVVVERFVIQNSRTGSDSGGIYLYSNNFTLKNSSVINNTGGRGAGIFMIGNANLTVLNSTISGNRAGSSGGGIHAVNGMITINNSTIAYNNSNVTGGGVRKESGTVSIQNSVLALNTATTSGPDCSGAIDSSNHNILGNTAGCTVTGGAGDQFNVDPWIASALSGTLPLYTLQATSPAINAGDNSTCLATDQRGVPRPQGSSCDSGSYELAPSSSISVMSGSNQSAQVSTAFALPLSVLVIDELGDPASGVTVTFTAPASGASGTFADSGTYVTTAVTGSNGMAASTVLTANDQVGPYTVNATAEGYTSPAVFDLQNIMVSLADFYVSPGGSDSNSCSAPTAPCLTINAAINKAAVDDAIAVAAGTYAPITISKSLRLSGGWDPTFTALTGYSIVQGSTTVNAISTSGTLVSLSRFVAQGSKYGIYHNAGVLNFERGALINNKNGIYNYAGDTTFTNVTISGNQGIGTAGSGISNVRGTVRIQYSTISNNSGSEAIYSLNGDARIIIGDSILAGNPVADCRIGSTNMTSTGHNIFGRSPACAGSTGFVPAPSDQVGIDPQLFVLFPSGYHPIPATSPAVDRADPATCPTTDQRGAARPQGVTCDIGAYEYRPAGPAASLEIAFGSNQHSGPSLPFIQPLAVYVLDAFGSPISGATVTFTAPWSGPSGTFGDTGANVTTAITDNSGRATSAIFTANSQTGSYDVKVTAEGLSGSVSFALTNAVWFVAPTGSDTNSCNSPASACLTINGAVAKAADGESIRIASGTYAPVNFSKSLTLLGGWENTFTSQTGYSTIQSSATVDGISISGAIIFISRFVVQGSRYGIYHSSGTLRFEQGALLNNKNGIYNYGGDVSFTNITISGNDGSGVSGSAINNYSGMLQIQYSTISGNLGSYAIYDIYGGSHIEIGNSILAGNSGADCYVESTLLSSAGHNIFGRSPACSNTTSFVPDPTDRVGTDPQLSALFPVGYYPVSPTSPAVDQGNPVSCPATDQRGVARPQGAVCDIGAYEYTAPGAAASFGIASGSDQHSGPSLPFTQPLAVYVMDAAGSPVSGVSVTFTAPASGPSGTFADSGTNVATVLTNSSGIAITSTFTANSQMGSYNVVAATAGLAGSVSIALTNAAWFVTPTGNNANSCNMPVSPCLTINGAIDKAANGDAILVAVGTYAPVSISKSLTLLGGWENTFTSQTGYSTIQGTSTAHGISVGSQTIIIARLIVQNSNYGIYHNSSSTGTLRFEQGALLNNKNGIYNYGGETTFINTTFSGNDDGNISGSAIRNESGTVRIHYSTIANNAGSYAIYSTSSSARIEIGNTILAGNGGADCYIGSNTMTSAGHNIFGRSPACSNTTSFVPDPTDQVGTDPQLSALLPLGYHPIAFTSPAVDQGNPVSCPATDQRGVARPQGTVCDIGAYEYVATPGVPVSFGIASGSDQHSGPSLPFTQPLAVYVTDAFGGPVSGVSVTFTAPASGPSGTFADTQTSTTIATTNDSGIATSAVFTANSQTGSYNVVATVAGLPGSVSFALANAVWFVALAGNNANSCTSPASPCLTIDGAVGKAVNGDAILVAVGTYAPVSISKSLTLLGGWDTTFTSQIGYSTIQGTGGADGISISGQNVSVSRFIVQNNYRGIYHSGTGILRFEQGASLNNSHGLRNESGDVILTNLTISGATGTAITNNAGTIWIQYSTITNNTGLYAINSTNSLTHIELGNSILAGNSGADCNVGSNMSSAGHNIFGRSPACSSPTDFVPDPTDRVGIDPQLATLLPTGYHALASTSPAIDQGNPASCPGTDQRGVARPQGAVCDIGAYEYTVPGAAASFGILSGSNQRAGPSLPFIQPLAVYVTDAFGSPVSGVSVIFTAPSSGPSGTFADGGTNVATVLTNGGGVAATSTFTANPELGSYNVVATVTGLPGSVNLALTNAAWFVAPSGNNTNSCSVPTSPCLTISGAMTKAFMGDAILVAVGTYPPISISKSLTLSGGWDNTFTAQTGYSNIQGDGGTSSYGITTSAPIVSISRFIVQHNHYGIKNNAGTLTFEQGALVDNDNGLYNYGGDTNFTNTTISGNHALGTVGSAISNPSGTVRIRYTTITNNSGTEAISSYNGSAHIEIGDSILAGNPDGDCYVGSANMTSTGHNIFGRSPVCSSSSSVVPDSTDQVGVDPQLSALFLMGYHPLSPTSPAVDHANPATCPATDQRGVERPQGAACDIGAFEYSLAGPAALFGIISGSNQRTGPSLPFILPLAVYVVDVDGNPVSGATVTFTAPSSGPSGTFADSGANTTSAVSAAGIATSPVFIANSQMGTYSVVVTVAGLSDSLSFTLTNIAWFVAPGGSDTNSCSVSTAPCLTISGAMTKAAAGDAIMVAAGTYPPITIGKSLSLWGGWDNAFTSRTGYSTVDGDLNSNGISVSGSDVFVSRFVTQNNYFGIHHSGGGMLRFDQGASINNSNGLYNLSGDMVFTNTTLSGNYVRARQGVYYAGSAISNVDGLIRVQYSTITNNGGSEALWSANGSAQIEMGNSILAGNPGGECPEYGINITTAGHNIFGSSCGEDFVPQVTDQVGVDPKLLPLFPKGYHPLLSVSPAIDAADPLSCPMSDQRGIARLVGTACDIGAVEYTSAGTTPTYILVYQGSPQILQTNHTAASRLVAVVLDENGNTVQGKTVTFTAPEQGASVLFADTGTNITTAVTDVDGLATSPAFAANDLTGSYIVVASVDGAAAPANFSLGNSTIPMNAQIRTYTANNNTTLPGVFLCDQTQPGCTDGRDVHADAAHKYAIGTYSFYASQYDRNSIDNAGMAIISSVHVASGYANAGWTGAQMVYGDAYGFPLADDVVGHELTHGVTQYESNLFYYYQSGAINESFSDLWGEYYDQTNGMGNDDASVQWLMGEDVTGLGAIRSMSNPPAYSNPDRMTSTYYYTGAADNGGVHTNSGVNNKAVFLMVQGGSFNGKTVAALGWDKTGAIYYEANTNLLSSGADYSDLYYALQQACTNLIGQKGIMSADCAEVKNAADAVEMNGQPVANFNPEAPYCAQGYSPAIHFSDDLESGTGNWTLSNGSTLRWQLDSIYGVNAHSGSHSLYADDYPPAVTDASARLASTILPDNAYLHFAHAYDFQTGADGGVLEYSVDGGTTWQDAGSLIDFNGYKATINSTGTNPLKGRSAFTGSSHGYISTRLNLAPLAGQTVAFRWRMGLDSSGYMWGWWLDDVKIYQCAPDDTTAPAISAIVRIDADPASAASVDFSVTFSEPVTGVDANDFALETTGDISGANITNVTGASSTWTVTVDTGSGDGTLGLNVPLGAEIRDLAGNSLGGLPFTGEQYTLDKTAPAIASIVRLDPDPSKAASVSFRVTFSEAVLGVDTAMPFSDFNPAATGITGAAITGVGGSGATWTVAVNTGSGDGTLGLDLAVDTGITDPAGNPLMPAPFAPDEKYTIDKTHAFLVAPANGEQVLHRRPIFDWSDVSRANAYRIAASTSSSFDTVLWEVEATDSTYTPGADLPGGQVIYWRVRAKLDEGWASWSETWSFTTGNPPSVAVLVSPASASLTRDYTPLLDWNNSTVPAGAAAFDHYQVQVATDTFFTSPVLIDVVTAAGQIAASSYTPTADLAANATYFWRVRAYNVSGQYSSWSTVWSFRTALLPPGNLVPDGGVTVSSRKPTLDWDAVEGATGYNIQISTSSSFGSLLVNTSTTANTFTPSSNLPAHRLLYWRVRATGANGPGSWTTGSFRTP